MIRLRFGFRDLVWFAPNVGVFVRYIKPEQFDGLANAASQLRTLLTLAGLSDLAAMLICEKS